MIQLINIKTTAPIYRYLNVLSSSLVMDLGGAQTGPDPPHTDVELVERRPVQAVLNH